MSQFTQFTGGIPSQSVSTCAFITKSGTFTTPITGWYKIWVCGAGGTGGISGGGNALAAAGGGAGGLAYKLIYLSSGTAITITVGAGSFIFTQQNGVAGGASSVNATGLSMTANGGGGGNYSVAALVQANGGAGGTASGGDFNWTGGAGGNAITNAAQTNFAVAGGGAVSWQGTAYRGGNATCNTNGVSYGAFGGGAGIAGRGGDSLNNGNVNQFVGGAPGSANGSGFDRTDDVIGNGAPTAGIGGSNTQTGVSTVYLPFGAWGINGGVPGWGGGNGMSSPNINPGLPTGLGGAGGCAGRGAGANHGGGGGGDTNGTSAGGSGFVFIMW